MSTTTVPASGRATAPRRGAGTAGGQAGRAPGRPAATAQRGPAPAGRSAGRAGVARRRRSPRAPFVLLVLALLAGGLATMLLLNTVLAQGAFVRARLEQRSAQLADTEQRLTGELAVLNSP